MTLLQILSLVYLKDKVGLSATTTPGLKLWCISLFGSDTVTYVSLALDDDGLSA